MLYKELEKKHKKVYPIYSDEKTGDVNFTIDTNIDSMDTTGLNSGLYLTRSYFYTVYNTKGEIKSTKLKGDIKLDKKDYTKFLQNNVKWLVLSVFVLMWLAYFVVYFLVTMFYAFCAVIAEKTSKKSLDFDKKMRLSAVCFILVLSVSFSLSFINFKISHKWLFGLFHWTNTENQK